MTSPSGAFRDNNRRFCGDGRAPCCCARIYTGSFRLPQGSNAGIADLADGLNVGEDLLAYDLLDRLRTVIGWSLHAQHHLHLGVERVNVVSDAVAELHPRLRYRTGLAQSSHQRP